MKSLIQAVVVTAVLVTPIVSFAQSNPHVTREQVRAELVQLEKVGYNPHGDSVYYPANIQAAETRVMAQNDDSNNVEGVTDRASSPAIPVVAHFPAKGGARSIYFGR
jgi:hypothetical protein